MKKAKRLLDFFDRLKHSLGGAFSYPERSDKLAEGKLEFDTKINTSEFDKGVASVQKKAKKTAESVSASTADAAEKTVGEVSKSAEKIKEILDDTSRSEKSKASSIGAIFKKEGIRIPLPLESISV